MNPGVFALRTRLGSDWEIPTGQNPDWGPTGESRLGNWKSRLGPDWADWPDWESRLGPDWRNPDWAKSRLENPDWARIPTGPDWEIPTGFRLGQPPDPDWARSANTPDWEIPTGKWHVSSRTDCSSRKQLRLSRDSVGQPSVVPAQTYHTVFAVLAGECTSFLQMLKNSGFYCL